MKVRCIKNKISAIPQQQVRKWLKKYLNYDENHSLELIKKGQVYTVYGLHFWEGHPFYFICEEEDGEYPVTWYAGFFEVLDDRISKYWRLTYHSTELAFAWTSLVHKDWIAHKNFYENLVDGCEEEITLFCKYRKEMEEEFDSDSPA